MCIDLMIMKDIFLASFSVVIWLGSGYFDRTRFLKKLSGQKPGSKTNILRTCIKFFFYTYRTDLEYLLPTLLSLNIKREQIMDASGWIRSHIFGESNSELGIFVGRNWILIFLESRSRLSRPGSATCSVICCWFDEDQDYKGINVTR